MMTMSQALEAYREAENKGGMLRGPAEGLLRGPAEGLLRGPPPPAPEGMTKGVKRGPPSDDLIRSDDNMDESDEELGTGRKKAFFSENY